MSSLIKAAADRGEIAAVGVTRRPPAPSQPSPIERELATMRGEIAGLRAALVEQAEAAASNEAQAYQAGEAAGRQAAADRAMERAEQIDEALRTARGDFDRRLDDLEILAVQLAKTVLAKLFADHDDHAGLVIRAVGRKLAELRARSVVTIVVSETDFGDAAAFDRLRALIAGSRTAIEVDAALPTGGCRLDLDLGHVDLGVDALAGEADAALCALSQGRRA